MVCLILSLLVSLYPLKTFSWQMKPAPPAKVYHPPKPIPSAVPHLAQPKPSPKIEVYKKAYEAQQKGDWNTYNQIVKDGKTGQPTAQEVQKFYKDGYYDYKMQLEKGATPAPHLSLPKAGGSTPLTSPPPPSAALSSPGQRVSTPSWSRPGLPPTFPAAGAGSGLPPSFGPSSPGLSTVPSWHTGLSSPSSLSKPSSPPVSPPAWNIQPKTTASAGLTPSSIPDKPLSAPVWAKPVQASSPPTQTASVPLITTPVWKNPSTSSAPGTTASLSPDNLSKGQDTQAFRPEFSPSKTGSIMSDKTDLQPLVETIGSDGATIKAPSVSRPNGLPFKMAPDVKADPNLAPIETEKGWADFGAHVLSKAPDSVKNGSKLDQAKYIAAMVGEQLTEQGVMPNYSIETRFTTGLSSSGTCGHTSLAIEKALKGAGFTHTSTVYGQKDWTAGSIVDVNFVHTTTATVIDGTVYTFDIWKYAKDNSSGPSKNFKDFIYSQYNGMPVEGWGKWTASEGYTKYGAHKEDEATFYQDPKKAFQGYVDASNMEQAIKNSNYEKLAENLLLIKSQSEEAYKAKLDKFKKDHPDQFEKLVAALKEKSTPPTAADGTPASKPAEPKGEKKPVPQTAAATSVVSTKGPAASPHVSPHPALPPPPADPTLITDNTGKLKPGYTIDQHGMAWSDKPSFILIKGPDGQWHDETPKQPLPLTSSTSGPLVPKPFPQAAQPPSAGPPPSNILPELSNEGIKEIHKLLTEKIEPCGPPFTSFSGALSIRNQRQTISYKVKDCKIDEVVTSVWSDPHSGNTTWKVQNNRLIGYPKQSGGGTP